MTATPTPDPATLWHKTAPPLAMFTALHGKAEADLLVIGGGFSGLSTALHAAEAGLSVVLLEAHRLTWGASGRNAGFVVPNFAKVDPDAIRARLGAKGDSLISLAAGGGDLVFDLIRRHQIECDALQSGWIQPSHSRPALAKAQDRVRQWSALKRPVDVLDAAEVARLTGVTGWCGGWIDRSGGVLNPVSYGRGLARAATKAGAILHEATPVLGFEKQASDWVARTPHGQVKARRIIVATNAYIGQLWPNLARSFFPLKVYQVATEPLPLTVRDRLLPGGQCVSDSRRNLFTFRFDAENRLISGGMPILPFGADARVPNAIHARMARMLDLPDLPPLAYRWSGLASVMPDFLPRVIELAPGMLAGFSCNGRGIALSTAMGRALVGWATGAPADALALPLQSLRPLPLHTLARFAPNALLPLSMMKDRVESSASLRH